METSDVTYIHGYVNDRDAFDDFSSQLKPVLKRERRRKSNFSCIFNKFDSTYMIYVLGV